MPCPLAHLDGSYVLGALPAAERQDYERHLTGCDTCAASVRDLAGLPGLLAHTSPDVLDLPADEVSLPATLLPRLTTQVRAHQRRRRWAVAAAATAAAAAVALGALWIPSLVDDTDSSLSPPAAAPSDTTPSHTARPMTPLGDVPLTAEVSLEEVAWGTRLSLTCRYASRGSDPRYDVAASPTGYALVVHTRGGGEEQVATWRAVPGRTLTVEAATALRPDDIARVEIHTTDGVAVLRLAT